MSLFYHFWKIWLRASDSKENASKEISIELPTQNILKTNKDIAEKLITEDIEISYSNLTYIIDQYDRIVREMICEGYSVKTNNVIFTPRLSGKWDNECTEFDPKIHKCFVDCTLSPETHNAIGSIGVKVLGLKDTSHYISNIINPISGEVDSIIHPNEEIMIEGKGIQAIAKDGSTHNCILLANKDNEIFDIGSEISVNELDKTVLRIPKDLEKGKYHLSIQTYFSKQQNIKPAYHCCIEFPKTITVK